MSIVLLGSTSGSCTLQEQAVAGTTVLTLPTFNGTVGLLVSGTAVASTSGTSIDFTSLPVGVRRITVMFNAVSGSGTSIIQIQLGTISGVTTTGYTSHVAAINAGTGQASATTGHIITNGSLAANAYSGNIVFTNVTSNNWIGTGLILNTGAAGAMAMSASLVGLSGSLDRVRITTVNGTDTFDAGAINILYE